MARVVLAFGANDARNVRRDSMLLTFLLAPLLAVLVLRLAVPLVTAYLDRRYGFDLTPYYPLLLSLFVLGLPSGFGSLAGFMVLDERDDDTLTALRVTPASISGYATYRIITAIALSFLYTLGCISLTGLAPGSLLPDLIPAALLAGLFSPLVALMLATLANNKVEGLALGKAFGIFLLGPLAAYFVVPNWQLLLGILPTYWPAKAFWVAAEGGNYWPYFLIGLAYNLALVILLLRRFKEKVF
ncbi:fluoroquinolones efflux ABC transporter permease [soil metagenome]